jgi:GntR family transcriptional regulator, transcriptional repressor for pyruvate dehydrogenase complex
MEGMAPAMKPVGRQENLYEAVAAQLREAILSRALRPGQTLPNETELARQMAVSRPVIREALRFLQAQGLVQINRGTKGGAVVGEVDNLYMLENAADMIRLRRLTVDHLIQVRNFVEPEVFRLAAQQASDAQLAELKDLVEATQREEDLDLRREMNGEFHRLVGRVCGNPIYTAIMERVLDFTLAFVHTLKPRRLILHKDEEHPLIMAALLARDADRAASLLLTHIMALHAQIKELESTWLRLQREEHKRAG